MLAITCIQNPAKMNRTFPLSSNGSLIYNAKLEAVKSLESETTGHTRE